MNIPTNMDPSTKAQRRPVGTDREPSPARSASEHPATLELNRTFACWRWFRERTLFFIVVVGLTLAPPILGAGQYLKLDYPASTASSELQVAVTYTLWIPDVKTIRAIIVH